MKARPLILFDGVCGLCNAGVDFIRRRDTKEHFDYLPLQSSQGEHFLAEHHLSTDLDTVILFKEGSIYRRSDAVLEIVKVLPRWRYFYVFKLIPRPLRDLLYNIAAKYRYVIFPKRDECRIIGEKDEV